jgi:hypothetical protein
MAWCGWVPGSRPFAGCFNQCVVAFQAVISHLSARFVVVTASHSVPLYPTGDSGIDSAKYFLPEVGGKGSYLPLVAGFYRIKNLFFQPCPTLLMGSWQL